MTGTPVSRQEDDTHVYVYTHGPARASACAPAALPDDEITAAVSRQHPCWRLAVGHVRRVLPRWHPEPVTVLPGPRGPTPLLPAQPHARGGNPMTSRIRWEPNGRGGFAGYVGSRDEPAFTIFPPLYDDGEWSLACSLVLRAPGRCVSTDPDELKATAERWLSEFVASLGAVFPDAPYADPDCAECGFRRSRHNHDKDCSHYREPAKETGQ